MLTTDRVGGAALVLIGTFTIWESLATARKLPLGTIHTPGPAYVPVVLATLLIAFGLAILVMGARAPMFSTIDWSEWRHVAGILGACVFAAVALERLGYRLTLTLVLFSLLAGLERRWWVVSAAYAVALAFGTFTLFDTLLRVPLPRGALDALLRRATGF
jgi:hypothetical protein